MAKAGSLLTPQHIVHLRTERLVLRRFTRDDAELLIELDSDPEVVRWVGQREPTTHFVVATRVMPSFLGWHATHPNQGFWATHVEATGEFIGWFHYRPAKVAPHELELGYRLRRVAWGKGYATEGARALLARAFEDLREPRVVASAYRENRASTRVMEKVGMVRERDEIDRGQVLDWYGIDAQRWANRLRT
jgi:RimJ/RimL family protein N-acetyltransferase